MCPLLSARLCPASRRFDKRTSDILAELPKAFGIFVKSDSGAFYWTKVGSLNTDMAGLWKGIASVVTPSCTMTAGVTGVRQSSFCRKDALPDMLFRAFYFRPQNLAIVCLLRT